MTTTIIGAGNMGRGIGTRLVAGGNDVAVVDRDPDEARALAEELGARATAAETADGDVVILALPYEAVADTLKERGSELAGKVVVDITNPADWSTMDGVVTPEGSSAAEEIARLFGECSAK